MGDRMVSEARRWTLEAARQMLPDVRERTERAVRESEALFEQRRELEEESEAWNELELQIQGVVSRWVREMEALGLDVKGLWLVDFDSGAGYYCWKWPEERLAWFHGYDEGFSGRTLIQ